MYVYVACMNVRDDGRLLRKRGVIKLNLGTYIHIKNKLNSITLFYLLF
jgi:hypothetical protein